MCDVGLMSDVRDGEPPPTEWLPDYVRGLLDPSAYPDPPDEVTLVQTHISYVFLAGGIVYKTKKPVDFGFVDQVAPEVRERFCHAEVKLNRRLSSDVYLDVVPVVRTASGEFAVEVEGEPVEWAVKMRRLPEDRMLSTLLGAGDEPDDIVERLVARLVRFHAEAERAENDPEVFGAAGARSWWEREWSEMEGNIGATWRADLAASTREYVNRVLDSQAALFDERLAEGRVLRGHGDLRTEHVYVLGTGVDDVQIVDCIEFTDGFQIGSVDVGHDVAFLAMDLEANDRAAAGEVVVGRYIAATADETLGVLQPLHRIFRALVRGKVDSLQANAADVPGEERRRFAESALRYFSLAAEYAKRVMPPSVVIMTGLSGTGKSLVGATLAGRSGAAYVSSDAVRKRRAGIDVHEHAPAVPREGIYSEATTKQTYEEMRRRAREHLAAGRAVVLDATHGRAADRAAALALAEEEGVPALIVELRLGDEATLARIEARRFNWLATSDADDAVYRHQQETFEEVTASEQPRLALDASLEPRLLAEEIAGAI